MSLPFDIRTARAHDIPGIIELFGQLDDLHAAGVPYAFRGSSTLPRSAQRIADMVAGPHSTMLVAITCDRVLGHTGIEIVTRPSTRMRCGSTSGSGTRPGCDGYAA